MALDKGLIFDPPLDWILLTKAANTLRKMNTYGTTTTKKGYLNNTAANKLFDNQ